MRAQQRQRQPPEVAGVCRRNREGDIWTVAPTTLGPNQSFICCLPSEGATVRHLKGIRVAALALMALMVLMALKVNGGRQ